jgi:hypothetical protein
MYKEIYRSCGFAINNKGLAIFDSVPPLGGHWDRFFTIEEIRKLDPLSTTPLEEKISMMHTGVDRAHNGAPCYTGDLRYRPR